VPFSPCCCSPLHLFMPLLASPFSFSSTI
jgi:hypothetical protein